MTPDLLPPRFATKIRVDGDCWIFTGAVNSRGYGCIAVDGDGTTRLARRASYELLVGPIPDGLTIDHLCTVKRCCNPKHLEPVTSAENNRRAREMGLTPFPPHAARNAVKTHCLNGHPFSGDNTFIDKNGWRVCVVCRRARDRKLRIGQLKRRAVTA